jgi:hypothetical protein
MFSHDGNPILKPWRNLTVVNKQECLPWSKKLGKLLFFGQPKSANSDHVSQVRRTDSLHTCTDKGKLVKESISSTQTLVPHFPMTVHRYLVAQKTHWDLQKSCGSQISPMTTQS